MMSGFAKGLLVGLGVSAVGFYLYKKNEQKVDSFLRGHGFPVPESGRMELADLSLEELMETKEDIEDIIAEREMSGESIVITGTAAPAAEEAALPEAKKAKK